MRLLRLLSLGAIALAVLSACSVTPDPGVATRIDRITERTTRASLEELIAVSPRFSGSEVETERTLRLLTDRLESYGYRVRLESCGFEVGGVPQSNLIAELRGEEDPNTILEIGAHYDTVRDCPGADDNGTGVVGLLEIARVVADARVERTIRFCFFCAEELGLLGSTAHVAKLDQRPHEEVEGILVLEMIGYATDEPDSQDAPIRVPLIASLPYTGNFIGVVGNFSSGGLGTDFERCADTYTPDLPYYSANRIGGFFADAARSDHSPYWRAGRRGIMLTDTANFRNPHYHQPTDTIDTINFTFMTQVTRAAAATALHWAGLITPLESETEANR